MNFDIPLEDFIDEEHDFIISSEQSYYNSGQFLLKNSPWSHHFLDLVYNHHPDCIHHRYWEQQAIAIEMRTNSAIREKALVLSQRQINSYTIESWGHWDERFGKEEMVFYQPGDFILHFPGVRNLGHLQKLMEKYSRRVIDSSTSIK